MRPVVIVTVALALVGCESRQIKPVTTVTKMAGAFRRLELLGYSHIKDSNSMGQDIVLYERKGPNADFAVQVVKWSGNNRIKLLMFSCSTNEEVFKSGESRLELWDEMERDMFALVNARQDYLRAVSDLHEVKEDGMPAMRHEGRATTMDGWQIQVIEDIGHYKPMYKKVEKKWVRVGMIWVTHLETKENIPASAVREFERWLEDARKGFGDKN